MNNTAEEFIALSGGLIIGATVLNALVVVAIVKHLVLAVLCLRKKDAG